METEILNTIFVQMQPIKNETGEIVSTVKGANFGMAKATFLGTDENGTDRFFIHSDESPKDFADAGKLDEAILGKALTAALIRIAELEAKTEPLEARASELEAQNAELIAVLEAL